MSKFKKIGEYKPGDIIDITCAKEGCEGVNIPVTLVKEIKVDRDYIKAIREEVAMIGRFGPWSARAIVRGFTFLPTPCECPNCGESFDDVTIISDGKNSKPAVFSYASEPVEIT